MSMSVNSGRVLVFCHKIVKSHVKSEKNPADKESVLRQGSCNDRGQSVLKWEGDDTGEKISTV